MARPLIEVKNLCKYFSPVDANHSDSQLVVKAIDEINLSIERGEYLAIIGPSGSGKSTLMQVLGLLDRPSSGQYHFFDRDISKLSDDQLSELRSLHIGFVFQSFNLLGKSTAFDNVELPMIYAGHKDRAHRVQALLEKIGLGERLKHTPTELSGGQQQRVAVARALANNPPVIFADEPTGNLNQESAHDIMETLRLLNESGVTVIVVTHDPNVAARANRIITIVDGKVQKDDRRVTTKDQTLWQERHFSYDSKIEFHLLIENFKMAMKSLAANKLRTSLSALGIMIGVASVIAMVALGQGAQKSMQDDLKKLGSNLLSIRRASSKLRTAGMKTSESLTLADEAAIRDLSKIGVPIDRVSPVVDGSVQVIHEDINISTRVLGVSSDYAAIYDLLPAQGRFFSDEENHQRRRVSVIGKTVYDNLFPSGDNPLNTYIKVNRVVFQVIGILPAKGGSSMGDRDDVIIVPIQTAMRRILGKDKVDQIAVQIASFQDMGLAMSKIEELLRYRHRITSKKDNDFDIRNMADIQETLSSTTRTMTLLLGIIASISLLVGGISIMNIMLVSVKERTREIGLRKALGAKNRHVLVQFLIEAVVIGALGGLTGAGIGILISLLLSLSLGWAVLLSPWTVVLAFLFSTSIAVVFGYWPAKQAASLSPIEALRH